MTVTGGSALEGVRGLLVDIDGVLMVSWEPIPGAPEALADLRDRGIPFRLVTNTTSHSQRPWLPSLAASGSTSPETSSSPLRRRPVPTLGPTTRVPRSSSWAKPTSPRSSRASGWSRAARTSW